MKAHKYLQYVKCIIVFLILTKVSYALTANYCPVDDSLNTEKAYYAIEINGVVCGYSEASGVPITNNGKDLIKQEVDIFIMLSLLGSEFNTEMNSTALVDPETRKATHINTDIKQGQTDFNIELTIKDNKAIIKSPMSTQLKEIEITPETVIGSDEMFTRLKKEFYSEMGK